MSPLCSDIDISARCVHPDAPRSSDPGRCLTLRVHAACRADRNAATRIRGKWPFSLNGKMRTLRVILQHFGRMLTVMCDNVVVSHFQRLVRLGFHLRLSHAPRPLSPALDLVTVSARELAVICDVRINGQRDSGRADRTHTRSAVSLSRVTDQGAPEGSDCLGIRTLNCCPDLSVDRIWRREWQRT